MQASSSTSNLKQPKNSKNPNPFPQTTGKYEVGIHDFLSGLSTDPSSVLIRFFYPTTKKGETPNGTQANWHENTDYITSYAPTSGIAKLLKHYWKNVKTNGFFQEHGIQLASDFLNGDKLEAVVFSHGLVGNRFMYSMTCEEIASHGYLVAAVEHRDGSASLSFEIDENLERKRVEYVKHPIKYDFDAEIFKVRNLQAEKRTEELKNVCEVLKTLGEKGLPNYLEEPTTDKIRYELYYSECDSLINKISSKPFHLIGHSFGGGTVLNLVGKSPPNTFGNIIACDPWIFSLKLSLWTENYLKNSLAQSSNNNIVLLHSEDWAWPILIAKLTKAGFSIFEQCFSFPGTVHQTFSDAPHASTLTSVPKWLQKKMCVRGKLGIDKAFSSVVGSMVYFLKNDEMDGFCDRDEVIRRGYLDESRLSQNKTEINKEMERVFDNDEVPRVFFDE